MNARTILSILAVVAVMQPAKAQLTTTPVCPTFSVDVLEGVVNERLDCTSTAGEVQKKFPCFSDVVEETNGAGCGAVFYKDKGISFFTEQDYIEIGENFKGKLIPALLGTSRSNLFKVLGNPKIKDISWDAFITKYGTLVLYYDKTGKINKLQITNKSAETLKLCE